MHESDHIEADYLIETSFEINQAVAIMAGEQSTGTFLRVPGETAELRARAAATIKRCDILPDTVSEASLPGATTPPSIAGVGNPRWRRALVTLSWPLSNIGPSLPNLMAMVAGNLFELQEFSGLRLLDIRLPSAFAKAYPGPAFGIDGTRKLTGVDKLPLIGTIIKPSIGLSPEETATLVRKLCVAGIDFIKDDELQSDGVYCPFEERVRAIMPVISSHAERTGKKVMMAFNLTGDLDQMRRRHDLVRDLGGDCVMLSLNSVGLTGVVEFRRTSELPIHAHRNGWGYLSRYPLLGWSYVAWQKFWRLAGVDHMHVNGLQSKFAESDVSVLESARECLTPIFPEAPCRVMPVFSGGQTARQASATFLGLGSADLIVTAGGGIIGHPQGLQAGVEALRYAWESAIENGISINRRTSGDSTTVPDQGVSKI